MSQPKVLILRTAGTNCDEETAHAWTLAGASPHRLHIRDLMQHPAKLDEYAILTIPGGFSYGDDISAGKILAAQLAHFLSEALLGFVAKGRLVLGICNGFQVLVKAGLLPGPVNGEKPTQRVTLAFNDSARFEDRWVHVRAKGGASAFLPDDAVLAMPIAHAEGKLVTQDEAELARLESAGQVALRYCDAQGEAGAYPVNPNGSQAHIAGLSDATGRILGLMPHPERHVDPTQHPAWRDLDAERADGRTLFDAAIRAIR